MSKIICDICGTSYQETAKQCPICGCVRPGDAQRVSDGGSDDKVSTGYTYVKGGRFSKSNVKKRNKAKAAPVQKKEEPAPVVEKEPENQSNRGLVITAVVLFLAIVAVLIYFTVRFMAPISKPGNATTENTGNYQDLVCTDIKLDVDTILFEQAGEGRLLSVTTSPKNTVDKLTYESEDPSVATVTEKGYIVAVGEGTTKIIITCGTVRKECIVSCQFIEESTEGNTEATETEPEPTDAPKIELKLNRKDITFNYKGEKWDLYTGSIPRNQITWSSDDESIVTFVDGKATAVGSGTTTVYAEFEDQKVSCIIRCNFTDNSEIGGNGGVSEDGGSIGGNGGVSEDGGSTGNGGVSEDGGNSGVIEDNNTYAIYTYLGEASDITLRVGESITFYLKDSNGNKVTATWSTTSSALSLNGSTVKGESKTSYAKVTAVYNGKGYECIVRVS